MKATLAIVSLIIGIVGLGVFFNPLIEIFCGVTGLVLSMIAKDPSSSKTTKIIRSWGNSLAWINIIWVCVEIGLKFAGINLF